MMLLFEVIVEFIGILVAAVVIGWLISEIALRRDVDE